MPEILLTTLNARYAHASFGLRYLFANLGDLRGRARILEFDINQKSTDMIEAILACEPKILGLGIYIWNASQALALVGELKRLRPTMVIVLGGPEVSHETDAQEICRLADFVITGEADLAFAELCEKLLSGRRPLQKIIPADLPEFSVLKLPYEYYDQRDIDSRVIYVEASRGCPFSCEFCLSSLDVPVRNVQLDEFLAAMQKLLNRGVRQFKFVDRTFNLNLNFSREILEFFLERQRPGLFVHFEMIPDRLPEGLRGVIRQFPPKALQFEVGVQTFDPDVSKRISRRQDNDKLADNLTFLRTDTGVYVHADLIVGLPGEDVASFGRGFDRLFRLGPQEIQVGMLKRLRGTPIVRHDAEFKMVYSPNPPYEILENSAIDFAAMQRMRRFSRYWDLISNSGNFQSASRMLLDGESPFEQFIAFSDWMYTRLNRTHAIALDKLAELMFQYLINEGHPKEAVAASFLADYRTCGRRNWPGFLQPYLPRNVIPMSPAPSLGGAQRQMRRVP